MIQGFTGTRKGMTKAQRDILYHLWNIKGVEGSSRQGDTLD